jgi:hypothetical protein
VEATEGGYVDSNEYANDLNVRDSLEDWVAQISPTGKERWLELIAPLDKRFENATRHIARPIEDLGKARRWFWYRVPVRQATEAQFGGLGRKADHVTDDRALKRATRRRMEQPTEKWDARRALLGRASSGERYPWYYEPYWEDLRRRFEQQADEEGEAVARASVYHSQLAAQPSLRFPLTPFTLPSGRGPSGPDAWLARRPPVEWMAAIIEASTPLAAVGFGPLIERNRQIVDRVLAVIDERAAGASEYAQKAAESLRAPLGFKVPRPESQRPSSERRSTAAARPWGVRSREHWGVRSRELTHDKEEGQLDHFLRHPWDTWFLERGVGDPVLLELVDAWIEDLERNYAQLVKLIPSAWVEHVELDFEAVCEDLREEDGHGSSSDWPGGLPSPARVRLESVTKGELGNRELVATQKLLGKACVISLQPDGIAALPHARWIIRGHRLSDGTIMPCRGTYRLASARSV